MTTLAATIAQAMVASEPCSGDGDQAKRNENKFISSIVVNVI